MHCKNSRHPNQPTKHRARSLLLRACANPRVAAFLSALGLGEWLTSLRTAIRAEFALANDIGDEFHCITSSRVQENEWYFLRVDPATGTLLVRHAATRRVAESEGAESRFAAASRTFAVPEFRESNPKVFGYLVGWVGRPNNWRKWREIWTEQVTATCKGEGETRPERVGTASPSSAS